MSYCYYPDTSSPSSIKALSTKNINIKNNITNNINNTNKNTNNNTILSPSNNDVTTTTTTFAITFNNMTHQAWTIADLPHRRWRLKYLPDEFRAEDIRDENHPYFTLLKIFDQLRDLAYTTEDVPMLSIIEHKLKIVGKIIDNLIDLPGPYIKGVIDFTALSAYVHTINDLWSKKNQLMLTPVWRSHITSEKFSEYLNTEVYESFLLPTLYHISLILDWWLGDPQFEFWIGIIDLNFDQFETQLEAYVHFYNTVFFPEFKEGRKKENIKDDKKECNIDSDSSATTPSSIKSDDEESIDNDKIFKPLVHTDSSDFEWSDSDF